MNHLTLGAKWSLNIRRPWSLHEDALPQYKLSTDATCCPKTLPWFLRPKPGKPATPRFWGWNYQMQLESCIRYASSTISTHVTTCPQLPKHQVLAPPPWLGHPPSWLCQHCLCHLNMYTCLSTSPSASRPWSVLRHLVPGPSKPPYLSFTVLSLWHELTWPFPLLLTVSTLNTCTSQDKIHVAHTPTHAMVV
jgi:hypothetical protein